MVLNKLSSLYRLKYDSATACGLPLYLCSYKLVGFATNLIFKGFRYENIYFVDFNASEAQLSICLFTKSSMGWLWHGRLGHVRMKQLNRLVKHDLLEA